MDFTPSQQHREIIGDINPLERTESDNPEEIHELSERTMRKIENLKLEMKIATEQTVFDIKQLLLKDAEHFRKLKLSKTLDSLANNTHQKKELIARSILSDDCQSSSSPSTRSENLRKDWIMRAVTQKRYTAPIYLEGEELDEIKDDTKSATSSVAQSADPQPLLEGQLLKYRSGLIGQWKKVYCILYEDRFQIFKNKKKDKNLQLKYSINFRHFKTTLEFLPQMATSNGASAGLTLKLSFTDVSIQLREAPPSTPSQSSLQSNSITLSQWASKLEQTISTQSHIQKFKMEPNILTSLAKSEIILERDFLARAQSGDIVLFETKSMAAAIQRGATSSKFDHVGMVIRLSDGNIRIFDAVGQGVCLTEWNQFLLENGQYHSIIYRPLIYENREAVLPELYSFVEQAIGSKYSLNLLKLAKMTSDIADNNSTKKKSYFCSELIAKAYKEMGIISISTASSQYWPRSFSQKYDGGDLKFYDQASLDKEKMVLLSIEVLYHVN